MTNATVFLQILPDWVHFDWAENFMKYYEAHNISFGLLMPFIDAFIPIFPFVLIITFNVSQLGFFYGFLISWIGNVLGTLIMFFLARNIGKKTVKRFLYSPKHKYQFMHLIDKSGFTPVFLLLCLPFTPSYFVNLFVAISNAPAISHIFATIFGKLVMILSISYIGTDVSSLYNKPLKGVIVLIILIFLWYLGKKLENSDKFKK